MRASRLGNLVFMLRNSKIGRVTMQDQIRNMPMLSVIIHTFSAVQKITSQTRSVFHQEYPSFADNVLIEI